VRSCIGFGSHDLFLILCQFCRQLGDNQLTGTIPTELGLATRLFILYAKRNTPENEVDLLPSLRNLHKNGLEGTIPSQLQSTRINYLNLFENNLSGTIPTVLGLLSVERL
jgi:hypothetical protein